MPANVPFIIGAGAAGDIGYSNEDFWAADDCFCFMGETPVFNRYLFYWLQKNSLLIKNQVRKSSVPRISHSVIENMPIDVPSSEEQKRIVSILDRFDCLCNDLSSGLPAEIAARQKQYEYYRDKLLTFKPLA